MGYVTRWHIFNADEDRDPFMDRMLCGRQKANTSRWKTVVELKAHEVEHGLDAGSSNGFCARCWAEWEYLQRLRDLQDPRYHRCSLCDRAFSEVAYPDVELNDWDVNDGGVCLECAVQHLGAQYKDPGQTIEGNTRPEGVHDVLGLFLALSDAVFWSMVWANRDKGGKGEPDPRFAGRNEDATAKRLDEVEAAFNAQLWEDGAQLLAPIAAPKWSMDRADTPLYAWEPVNCHRTAGLWAKLREWRATQLPDDLRHLVKLPDLDGPGP